MKLKPMFDRIIVEQMKKEQTTASGLILPNTNQEQPIMAEIIAVGNGGGANGDEIPMLLKVGQKVLFNKYVGSEIKDGEKDYILLRQADVMAIIEEDN